MHTAPLTWSIVDQFATSNLRLIFQWHDPSFRYMVSVLKQKLSALSKKYGRSRFPKHATPWSDPR